MFGLPGHPNHLRRVATVSGEISGDYVCIATAGWAGSCVGVAAADVGCLRGYVAQSRSPNDRWLGMARCGSGGDLLSGRNRVWSSSLIWPSENNERETKSKDL